LIKVRVKVSPLQGSDTHASQQITQAFKDRQQWWSDMRSHVAVRARSLFIVHLQKRGLDGKLVFQHEASRLVIKASDFGLGRDAY
jgi:hypothetical protein